MCAAEGIDTIAEHVDHIVPARGDAELFWSEDNWQSLCEHHHNQKSAGER